MADKKFIFAIVATNKKNKNVKVRDVHNDKGAAEKIAKEIGKSDSTVDVKVVKGGPWKDMAAADNDIGKTVWSKAPESLEYASPAYRTRLDEALKLVNESNED